MTITRLKNWVSAYETDEHRSVGWYATLYCWDPAEGMFPGPNHWDGKQWGDRLPVSFVSPQSFTTSEEANRWADENDPEC